MVDVVLGSLRILVSTFATPFRLVLKIPPWGFPLRQRSRVYSPPTLRGGARSATMTAILLPNNHRGLAIGLVAVAIRASRFEIQYLMPSQTCAFNNVDKKTFQLTMIEDIPSTTGQLLPTNLTTLSPTQLRVLKL